MKEESFYDDKGRKIIKNKSSCNPVHGITSWFFTYENPNIVGFPTLKELLISSPEEMRFHTNNSLSIKNHLKKNNII